VAISGTQRAPRVAVYAVDDSAMYLRALASVVEAAGFDLVGTAGTGEGALDDLFGRADVDLVLLDVHLPGISGIEVARRYAEGGGRAVVVLMSTSDAVDLPVANPSSNHTPTRPRTRFLAKESLSTAALARLWGEATDGG
jgi:CheY-like chemotaxis protein